MATSTDTSAAKPLSSTSPATTEKKKQNNKIEYEGPHEFGGPIGTLLTTIMLPIVVLVLSHFASQGKIDLSFLSNNNTNDKFWDVVLSSPVLCPSCSTNPIVLLYCTIGLVCWFHFQVVLERVLPCNLVEGAPLPDGSGRKLKYRINGHLAFWVTLLLLEVGWPSWVPLEEDGSSGSSSGEKAVLVFGRAPLTMLYDYYTELALCTIGLSFLLSFYLYLTSFHGNKLLAKGGNTGYPTYDFFIGRELNPRSLKNTFDWKEFCELRPGLIGWMILNLAMMEKQYSNLGYVTGSMILVNVFQGIYVWDALYQERAILTTMDITTDGFGFMLVFGDLAWVPFTYSLQARYLVDYDPHLSIGALVGIVITQIGGYIIFRSANSQKDAFRRDPSDPAVSHLQYLQTKRGTRLLTSGWWGMARKINYTGDWIMGLSWCMVCGFDSIVPYYYAIYFCILLVHRSIRDDIMCQEKYGDDWLEYKRLVPYRFIPGII